MEKIKIQNCTIQAHTFQPSKIRSSYLQRTAEMYFSCDISHVASCFNWVPNQVITPSVTVHIRHHWTNMTTCQEIKNKNHTAIILNRQIDPTFSYICAKKNPLQYLLHITTMYVPETNMSIKLGIYAIQMSVGRCVLILCHCHQPCKKDHCISLKTYCS